MATSGSNNEVAAKMIGAQLQSLLKIPPIKKTDSGQQPESAEQKDIFNHVEEGRPAGYSEGKENARNYPLDYGRPSMAMNVELGSPPVAKDRFGRPFQSLDRRGPGRGRDFYHNGPRRMGGGGFRDREMHGTFNDVRGPDIAYMKDRAKGNRNTSGHKFEVLPTSRKAIDIPEKSSTRNALPSNSFHTESFIKYEQPPRFSGDEVKTTDLVDPSVRLLTRKMECPKDIREKIDFFHDKGHRPNKTLMAVFHRHCIRFLERKNPKFPKAKYFCTCCNYHMDNLYATTNHILQERHYVLEKMGIVSMTIGEFPEPSPDHTSYLTDLLIKMSKLHGMNHTERMQRIELVERLNEALKENGLECEAVLFGSSLSGFGFRHSNVNININVGNDSSQNIDEYPGSPRSTASTTTSNSNTDFSEVTSKLLEILKQLPQISEVREVYTPKCVSIHFQDGKSRSKCIINFNNTLAVVAAQLFSEYDKLDPRVKPLVLCLRLWARTCEIDDQEKGFLPSHCYAIMVLHYLQEMKGFPNLHLLPKCPEDKLFSTASDVQRQYPGIIKNTENIGELWLGLLKYFAVMFNYKDNLISISRQDKSIPKNEKHWNRKICIEDPVIPKSNLARSVTNNKICDFIIDRLKSACIYFTIPRKTTGALYDGILPVNAITEDELTKVVLEEIKPTTSQELQRMVRQIQKASTSDLPGINLDVNSQQENALQENVVRLGKLCCGQNEYNYVYSEDAKKYHNILFKKEYYYEFTTDSFSDGTSPPIICKACGADGHLKSNCPEETVPPYGEVDYPSPTTLLKLDSAIGINFTQETLDSRDVDIRKTIVGEVNLILEQVYPTAILTLFGSTYNGFGMHASDVDICLTFADVVVPEGERGIKFVDVNKVLERIVNEMKKCSRMTDILSIPSAKVPIVKFRHTRYNLEGDISLYNQLSIYNTKLLRLYVELDNRVAILGLFLKKLVKLCDIGDASKGSLSSYSYILMLIHFLQNHIVPVLPVLQEFQIPGQVNSPNGNCESHWIHFCSDIQGIRTYWQDYGKNKESVAQLWLAFLNYYVERFDGEKYVVTISQQAPLARAAKCWYTEGLAIEDPFDKSHNLGGGLTRRMSVHILKTFQRYRTFFHRSIDDFPNINPLNYYFDVRNIREGNPPIDRQCRICCRIGHIARNCTYVNKPDDRDRRVEDVGPPRPFVPVDRRDLMMEEVVPPPYNGVVIVADTRSYSYQTNCIGSKLDPWRSATPPNLEEFPTDISNAFSNLTLPAATAPPILPEKEMNENQYINKNEVTTAPRIVNEDFKLHHVQQSGQQQTISPNTSNDTDFQEPAKEMLFFGDIGTHNPDGEQIQAMLQKNEGVTFTFELGNSGGSQPNQGEDVAASEAADNMSVVMANGVPPGFCPPGGMYGVPVPGMQFIPSDQSARFAAPHGQPFNMPTMGIPIGSAHQTSHPYRHENVGMHMPFQPVIPLRPVPLEARPQMNGGEDQNVGPSTIAPSAPPPGFAPLPIANNSCVQQPEILRTFVSQYQAAPPPAATVGAIYSVAPVAATYQQQPTNSFNSPTFTTEEGAVVRPFTGINSSNGQPVLGNFDGGVISQGQNHSANLAHQPMTNLGHLVPNFPHQQGMQINSAVPNGQIINGGIGNQGAFPITAAGEPVFHSEYNPAGMPGNAPVNSYGLSLSQAHHGPVVSALQMQHSQHHPMQMQGGHFHHHVRPMMTMGAPYSFPQHAIVTQHQNVMHIHEMGVPLTTVQSVPQSPLDTKFPIPK